MDMRTLLGISLLLPMLAVAAETGTALKDDSLRAEPYADAKLSGKFTRGEKLEITGKQGAWLKVKTAKSTGWVRLLSVKRGTSTAGSSATGVLNVASGRAGTGQVVSTTGVRGLSAEELKAASYNAAEVQLLESYTVTQTQAQQFAVSGKLSAIEFKGLSASKEAE